jgi:hypothetical protein
MIIVYGMAVTAALFVFGSLVGRLLKRVGSRYPEVNEEQK